MEAKDTVMNDKEMVQAITDNPDVPMGQALIEKQAEISFKAGMKDSGMYEACKSAYAWYYEGQAGDYKIIGEYLKQALAKAEANL